MESSNPHPNPENSGPLLSVHAALVLLTAACVGAVIGVLAAHSTGDTAGSLLAGLSGFGISAQALHKLVGG